MKIERIHPSGVCVVTADRMFTDRRGVFLETYRDGDADALFEMAGVETEDRNLAFTQGNLSTSKPFVLRGMHYQVHGWQGKLLRCVGGSVYQVSIDVRKNSKTFGQWVGINLDAIQHKAVFVPPGFANGFFALQNGAIVHYEMTECYDEALDRALFWNDPKVGVKWPLGIGAGITFSEKDRTRPKT